jgi:hypothetical protein
MLGGTRWKKKVALFTVSEMHPIRNNIEYHAVSGKSGPFCPNGKFLTQQTKQYMLDDFKYENSRN